jgi:serine/threonine-protein kinase
MSLDSLKASLADRYTIERELGQGGMATVYLARDLKHDRDVAVKVLREDLSASLGGGRFLREIKIAAQLQHPHILPLLDSGDADGYLYYVMPYVPGQSLRQRLAREGELPVHEAVRLIIEVVDALAHAHDNGVVHRDIKPDNVMLSGRHALVADFGVAKAVSEATDRNTVTTLGVAVGTPTYMSPEQAAADPHVDHRSDIYAVGVLAYELITGRPPFVGATPQQVLAAHVTEAPDPMTKRRPATPPALDAIVLRCLAKRPADRFQTAHDLLAQLEPLATPSTGITPTETRPITAAITPPRRRRIPVAFAAVGAVALLVAAGWWLGHRGGTTSTKPRIVVLPARNLGGPDQAYLADGITEEINNRLVALSGIEVIGRTSAERYRDTKLTPKQIGAELDANYILALRIGTAGPADAHHVRVSAELLRAESEAQAWGKTYQADAAADNFKMQGEIAEQVAQEMGVVIIPKDRARIAARPTDDQEAYDDYLRGSNGLYLTASTTAMLDAVHFLQRAVDRDPKFAQAWAALAYAHTEAYWFRGDRTMQRLTLARAAAEQASRLAPDAPETQYVLGVLAYHGSLDFPTALRHLNAAIAADPGQARYLEYVAYVERRSGKLEDALVSARRALALDPRNVRIMGDAVGATLLALGRPEEMIPLARSAIDLSPDDYQAYVILRDAYTMLDKLPAAAAVARDALIRPGIRQLILDRPREVTRMIWQLPQNERMAAVNAFPPLGPDMRDTAMYHLVKGEVLQAAGLDGRASYEAAAAGWQARLKLQPEEGWNYVYLADALRGFGRRDEAIAAGNRGVELLGDRDFFEGPLASLQLAEIYLTFGDREHAAAAAERFIRAAPGNKQFFRYAPQLAALREAPSIQALLAK